MADVLPHTELDGSVSNLDEVDVGARDVEAVLGSRVANHRVDPLENEGHGSILDLGRRDLDLCRVWALHEMLPENSGDNEEGELGCSANEVALFIFDIDSAAMTKVASSG